MDPNETLKRLREIAALENDRTGRDDYSASTLLDLLGEMAEHFAALDEWLTRGGFLPTAWGRRRQPEPYTSETQPLDPDDQADADRFAAGYAEPHCEHDDDACTEMHVTVCECGAMLDPNSGQWVGERS